MMVSLLAWTGGIASGLGKGLYWSMWIAPFVLLFIIFISSLRKKMIFNYPVRIFRIRENGKVIETNKLGGYIQRKNSAPFFRIDMKIKWNPFTWWKKIDLTTTPNPKYIDEQNRVYYLQIDVATFVQLKRKFDLVEKTITDKEGKPKKVLYGGGFELTPVESDVKYGAILSMQRIREVTRQGEKWKTLLLWGAFTLLAIVHLIIVLVAMKG